MLNYNTDHLEKNCKQLMEVAHDFIMWKWDERFETVLAEFKVADEAQIQNLIKTYMGVVWDSSSKKKAPDIVKMVINYFGGLNTGQLLFTSNPESDDLFFCAWWPWGNGEKISIRLAVFSDSLNDNDNEELTKIFRGWFGV